VPDCATPQDAGSFRDSKENAMPDHDKDLKRLKQGGALRSGGRKTLAAGKATRATDYPDAGHYVTYHTRGVLVRTLYNKDGKPTRTVEEPIRPGLVVYRRKGTHHSVKLKDATKPLEFEKDFKLPGGTGPRPRPKRPRPKPGAKKKKGS
jgi:hypothetical protein